MLKKTTIPSKELPVFYTNSALLQPIEEIRHILTYYYLSGHMKVRMLALIYILQVYCILYEYLCV